MALTDEQKTHSREVVEGMLMRLGLDAQPEERSEGDDFVLKLKTDDPGRLIGRKGHCLRSLELLLNRVMRKRWHRCPWVELDVDGYQRKRRGRSRRSRANVDEERLEQIAVDAAKEVRRWGKARKLAPMDAAERRVVHMALRDEEGIETVSEDDGAEGRKRIIIRPIEGEAV